MNPFFIVNKEKGKESFIRQPFSGEKDELFIREIKSFWGKSFIGLPLKGLIYIVIGISGNSLNIQIANLIEEPENSIIKILMMILFFYGSILLTKGIINIKNRKKV